MQENRSFTKTISMIVTGESATRTVALELIRQSQWFEIEPLPDDKFEITVKAENERVLQDLSAKGASTEFVQLIATHDEMLGTFTDLFQTAHVVANEEMIVVDLARPGVRWQDGPRIFVERRPDQWRCYVHSDSNDARALVHISDDATVAFETFD